MFHRQYFYFYPVLCNRLPIFHRITYWLYYYSLNSFLIKENYIQNIERNKKFNFLKGGCRDLTNMFVLLPILSWMSPPPQPCFSIHRHEAGRRRWSIPASYCQTVGRGISLDSHKTVRNWGSQKLRQSETQTVRRSKVGQSDRQTYKLSDGQLVTQSDGLTDRYTNRCSIDQTARQSDGQVIRYSDSKTYSHDFSFIWFQLV